MNFPGRKLYPTQTDFSPARDAGPIALAEPTGIVRGGTVEDYNVKLRGTETRLDTKPARPYP